MKNVFLLIGAQKSGTTSIFDIFKYQEGLVLTKEKESKFFLKNEYYDKGLPYYKSLFLQPQNSESGPYLDVDPDFFHFSHVPQRIYNTFGTEIRFFLILRNPVDRAWSAWQMEKFRKREEYSFLAAIEKEKERTQGDLDNQRFAYLGRGLYHQQLQEYLKYFPLSAFKVYIFESDFIENRKVMLTDMIKTMGLELSQELPFELRRNPARKIRNRSFDRLLSGDNIIRTIAQKILPEAMSKRWKEKLYALNSSQKMKDRLSATDYNRIMDTYFSKDIYALQQLLDRDLSIWTQPRG